MERSCAPEQKARAIEACGETRSYFKTIFSRWQPDARVFWRSVLERKGEAVSPCKSASAHTVILRSSAYRCAVES